MSGFVPYELLSQGKIYESIMYVLNNYFLYGSFWLLIGIAIFAVIQGKGRNLNFSVIVMSLYFLVVSNFAFAGSATFFLEYIKYIQILLIVVIGYSLYKLFLR